MRRVDPHLWLARKNVEGVGRSINYYYGERLKSGEEGGGDPGLYPGASMEGTEGGGVGAGVRAAEASRLGFLPAARFEYTLLDDVALRTLWLLVLLGRMVRRFVLLLRALMDVALEVGVVLRATCRTG